MPGAHPNGAPAGRDAHEPGRAGGARAEISGIIGQVARHESNIRLYERETSASYGRYQDQPWYKSASAGVTYQAKRAYDNGLVAAQQTAIAAEPT